MENKMSEPNDKAEECERMKDFILCAYCDQTDLSLEIQNHVDSCTECREAKLQLESVAPSSETLAMLVLIRSLR